jgi:hypothetical protein
MFATRISISNPNNYSNSLFLQSKNIHTIIGVSPKYYLTCHNRVEVGIRYHHLRFLGQERSNSSNHKTCTQFWNNHIYTGLPSECVV